MQRNHYNKKKIFPDGSRLQIGIVVSEFNNDITDRMFDAGPWYALGDGETFEDMIFSSLTESGHIDCPECGEPVGVSEESLGRVAMSMLSQL